MKVLYSVPFKLAGGGIGNTAYYFVHYLAKHNLLNKVLTPKVGKTEIPKELIKTLPFINFLERCINSFNYRLLNRYFKISIPYQYFHYKLWDYYTEFYLSHHKDADIYHGWTLDSSYKKAKTLNMLTSAEGSSSHPFTSIRLLNEEYKKFGLNKSIPEKDPFNNCVAEVYRTTDIIFPSSPFVYDSMIAAGIDKKKLHLVPFGVDTSLYKPNWNKQFDKIIFIYLGSVMYRKGIQYLLPAFKQLNLHQAELWICGAIHNEIRDLVNKYNSVKNIKFLGHVNASEYLNKSHVFVFPSIEEGSALVSYEAMAAGLPIIVTYNSGSVARDSHDGFIIPIRDIEAIKTKILYFYKNQNQIIKMGKSARSYIEQFTWENHSEKRVNTYKKFLNKK